MIWPLASHILTMTMTCIIVLCVLLSSFLFPCGGILSTKETSQPFTYVKLVNTNTLVSRIMYDIHKLTPSVNLYLYLYLRL